MKDEYIPCLGGNIDDIISKVLGENNSPQNLKNVKKTYLDLYNDSKKELTLPFKHSHELLRKLQENDILLAINSNRLTYSLNEFVDKFYPDIDFVLIEGHNLNHPSKPSPFGVNRIINKADVSLDETIYIGDSITDIKTAQNAGIDCIIVEWGYGDENTFNHKYPLEVVDDFSQLSEIFGINYF
jgi:phosphoglycolate phosphatase